MSLREALGQRTLTCSVSSLWKHPWFLTPSFSGASQTWSAQCKPGLVNCEAPVYRTTIFEQQSAGIDYGINPLTGQPFFSADVFRPNVGTPGVATTTIDIPLYLSPAIAMQWRAIGWDGDPNAGVPQFFLDRGAALPPKQPSLEDQLNGATSSTPTPRNLRLLRSCDVWVHQPRAALTSQISLEPGIATGISNVTQTLGVKAPLGGDALRVMSGAFNRTAVAIDPTQSDYEEQTWDELLIGTVYVLSPVGASEGSEPDGTWQPYVRHNLFWNLTYIPTVFHQVTTDPGVPFIPPLAAGAAQLVINFLTASLNDLTQQSLNILQGHSLAGQWFTPTGGGSTSFVPTTPQVTPAQAGLNKAAAITAKLRSAAAAKAALRLDPPFPYFAQQMDPSILATT